MTDTTVWITRTLPGADETAARVEALGYTPIVAPLLDVVATDADPAPAGHDIAFTSPNGVRHYRGPIDTTAWCVGEATAEAARKAGFASVRTGPGDVQGLVEVLLAGLDRPLIHWAGAHVRGSLSESLQDAGLQARRVTAYRAEAVTVVPDTGLVDVVLLHSPRAAEVYASLAPTSARVSVAISAAADAPLATIEGLTRFVVEEPDETAMLAALGEAVYGLGVMRDTDDTNADEMAGTTDAISDPVRGAAPFAVRDVPPPRRGIGVPLLLATGLIASCLGAGGGWALSRLDDSDKGAAVSLRSELAPEIAQLRTAQASLVQQVGDLERGPDTARLQSRLESRLAEIDGRLDTLDSRSEDARPAAQTARPSSAALDQLRTRLDALEDMQGGADTPSTLPGTSPRPALTPALARRLGTLETRLDALEFGRGVPLPTPDISYSTESGTTDSEPTVRGRAAVPSSRPAATLPDSLPAFPREAVEAALDRSEDGSPAGRALRRFVRVRRVEEAEALDVIDAAMDRGDTREALAAFRRLPERARAAAPAWATLADRIEE